MAVKVVKPHVWSVVIGAVDTLRYMKLFVFEVTVLCVDRLSYIHLQAPVVQTLDSAIHWIKHYPADKY